MWFEAIDCVDVCVWTVVVKFVSWDYLRWLGSDCDCFGHRLIYVN